MSNLVKFVENLDFGQICQKFLKLIKKFKNLDFGQNLQNCRIWSKF